MHGLALIYTVRDLPGVAQFKIVQHDLRRTEVQIVAQASFDAKAERRLVEGFRARLGQGVVVEVNRVTSIATESSGKFRYVVSRVPTIARGTSIESDVLSTG